MIIKPEGFKYEYGANLRKVSGSSWQGKVVGFYSNKQTPEGYAIESEREIGSVQIYPVKALERVSGDPDGDQHFLFLMENIMTSPVKESQPHEDNKFINYYKCEECDESWVDEWLCACDDKCPKCNAPYTPYKSEEIK